MKVYKILFLSAVLGIMMVLAGCGSKQQPAPAPATEQPAQEQTKAPQKIEDIQIMAEDYAPYGYLNENKELVGVSVDLIKAAMKEENLTNQINVTPWSRIWDSLLNVPNTVAFTCGRTPEREDKLLWIGEVGKYTGKIYALKDKKIKINSLDDLKKYKIGAVQDHYTEQHLKKNGFEVDKNYFNTQSDEANLEKLYSGRIDVLIANGLSISHLLRTKGDKFDASKIESVYDIKDLTVSAYLVASKGTSEELIKKFQDGFKKINDSGTYKQIVDSYDSVK